MSFSDETFNVWTDGGCRDNPGPGSCAFVVTREYGEDVRSGKFLPFVTNNQAEYEGFIEAVLYLRSLPAMPSKIVMHSDSKLLVQQVNGNWMCRDLVLETWVRRARLLFEDLRLHTSVALIHVPREQNSEADLICNQVMDEHSIQSSKRGKPKKRVA